MEGNLSVGAKPSMPKFANVEEERKHCKERMAAAFRLFAKYGFNEGVAGHITCRDPEFKDQFWVNPFGMHFSQIKTSDLILVDHQGAILTKDRGVRGTLNRAAFAIHSKIHKARPDVVCACHSHSMYGKSFSSLGRLLDPITQDACIFYNDHVVFDDFTGVVVDLEEGTRIAAALGYRKAAILQNHGLLTVGKTVDEAAFWFITMEGSCQAQLLSDAACIGRDRGEKPILIKDEIAKKTHDIVGTPFAGWFSFQPYYDMIVAEQPDLLN